MNPIETVVFPLKEQAMMKAKRSALRTAAYCKKELEEANWDINAVAPYPDSWSREEFKKKEQKYKLYNYVTKNDPDQHYSGRRGPRYVVMSYEKFVQDVVDNAAHQYDQFVAKLNDKIGEVQVATLEGNHVWDYSFLKVIKEDGTKEVWKTQQIVNFSKLGKMFNQFPTRKVKNIF